MGEHVTEEVLCDAALSMVRAVLIWPSQFAFLTREQLLQELDRRTSKDTLDVAALIRCVSVLTACVRVSVCA